MDCCECMYMGTRSAVCLSCSGNPSAKPVAFKPPKHQPVPKAPTPVPKEADLHTPGAKDTVGKPRAALVLGGFARALLEVSKVGTMGAIKYSDNGWQFVPDGAAKYDDAGLRHWLYEHAGQPLDPESEYVHAAHTAWNALARLELLLREKEKANAKRD